SVTGLGAETVSYFYDKLGLLRTMGGRDSYVGASTYSPFGELLQLSLGTTSGKLAFQTWYLDEGTRRLTRNVVSNQAVTGSLLDANYTYDNDGNVKALADNGGTTDIQCFNYDYQRQLKESWTINTGTCGTTPSQTVMGTNTGAYWASYTYDTVGNRLTRTDHVKTGTSNTVYTYTPGPSGASVVPNGATGVGGPHSVASVSKKVGTGTATTTSYKYDSSGNMSLRGAETDTWDSEGKLATTKTGTAAAATNIYDADGNRILRRDPSGTTTLYLDSSEVKLAGTTKTSQRWYGFGSKIVATRTASALYLIAANDQGTASVQMDVATAAYVKRRFNPFGDARASTVSTGATWNGDHGFLDKPVDASGLTQVGARYYDASLGRFISVDPVLDSNDAIQANAYAYGANNPVTSSDPTGLRAWCGDTECTTPLPRPSGTGGDQSKGPPSPPAVDRSPSDSSRTSRAFDLVRSIAIAIWNPVSPGLTQFHEFAGDPLHNLAERLDTEGRHRAPTRFNQYQAERAKEAYRLRTGMLPTHRLGGPTAWRTNYRLWDKIGRIVESKPAKVLGFLGTVAAVTHDYGEHRSDGDSRTASVIKVGIETAISAAGAETLAPAGVLCGPAVEVCSPLLAGVGAWGGHELGGLVTDTFSSQINWTAGKLDDAGSAVADSKYAPWNW
ncbi:MAG: RHS repeat-associated core domain-containing protein, partial [Massilia sp.]